MHTAFHPQGAFTALITPFRDGAVDHDALRALVRRQIEGGIDGLVPCGTTGEAATMSDEEKLAVIRTVVEAAEGRVPIIAGTGSNDTRASVAFSQKVAALGGVAAGLVVTPYYNKPTQEGMARHFREIAEHGQLPVVLYNVPGRTSVSLAAETVARLAEHPQIVAIKEATGDMVLGTRILELCPQDFAVLSGDDFTTFPLMAVGGAGCISVVSNLMPGTMSALCRDAREGRYPEARALHFLIQEISRALFAESNPIPVKIAAAMMGWCTPELRAPLCEPSEATRQRVQAALENLGLLSTAQAFGAAEAR